MKKFMNYILFILLMIAVMPEAKAQLTFTGQIRPRAELRSGFGTPKPESYDPAFFISQRSRISFLYQSGRIGFQTSIQDVRVWGQDASTISNSDGAKLALHEAWANFVLYNKADTSFSPSYFDYLSIKGGRQEIIYDDSRLLGNLDWLQQGRRHDALVVKAKRKAWQADAGFAFNQHTDAFNYNGTYYVPANVPPTVKDSKGNLTNTPAGMIPLTNGTGWSAKTGNPGTVNMASTNGLYQDYKAFQYLYAANQLKSSRLSLLFFSDQFGKYSLDSVKNVAGNDTGYVFGRRFNQKGTNRRNTAGFFWTGTGAKAKIIGFSLGAWYQFGKDRDAQSLQAFMTTASVSYLHKHFTYTAGWDYLSGNDAFSTGKTNHRFDPLYGTPHKFWGYMDYFYVGTGAPTGGLSDPYLKVKYSASGKRLQLGLDYHHFSLANDQKDASGAAIDRYLGSEFDFTLNYALSKFSTVEWGLSYMAASGSMAYAKNVPPGTTEKNNYWSYLMVSVQPSYLFK